MRERIVLQRAKARFEHWRDGELLAVGEAENVITDVGLNFMHNQCYGTAGLAANGLNYIALSPDPLTETSASTTLSGEITTSGLQRTQGVVSHSSGSSVTTITYTFVATGSVTVRKAALFSAAVAGVMNHVLESDPPRVFNLVNADSLVVTFTITFGP